MSEKPMTKAEWKRRQRALAMRIRAIVFCVAAVLVALIIFGIVSLVNKVILPSVQHEKYGTLTTAGSNSISAYLIKKSEFARPGTKMSKVTGIVIHNADNAGTRAMEVRNYYEQLATIGNAYSSTHFVVDTDGKIVQCIPVNEVALASGLRNADTVAIEFCYYEEDGTPSKETYDALVDLVATLVNRFGLKQDGILRHIDISESGYACPAYFLDDTVWNKFKTDVLLKADELKNKKK